MKAVIDMQAIQGESRNRGIGRFTREFCRALRKSQPDDVELIFLFNLYLTSPFLDQLEDLDYIGIERSNADFWLSAGEAHWRDPANKHVRSVSEQLLREKLSLLKTSVFVIPSLFEGYYDNCVTLVPDSGSICSVVFNHDLIPMHDESYNTLAGFRDYYEQKLSHLFNASLILTPSSCTKNQTIKILPRQDKCKVVTVGEGCAEVFSGCKVGKGIAFAGNQHKPYFLVIGINDGRKGFDQSLAAYALLPPHIRNNVIIKALAPISNASSILLEKKLDEFKLPKSAVELIGHVSDESLASLYSNSVALLFLSGAEGFGLPILEAMSCNTAVIAANCTAIPEVTGGDYLGLVDRENINDIAHKMALVLDERYRQKLVSQGLKRIEAFSWHKTAKKSWLSISETANHQSRRLPPIHRGEHKYAIRSIFSSDCLDSSQKARILACSHFMQTATIGKKSIFIDISEIIKHDSATGVQRVTRENILHVLDGGLQASNPAISPVFCYANAQKPGYCVALVAKDLHGNLSYTRTQMPIAPAKGDLFFGLDLQHDVVIYQMHYLDMLYSFGVHVVFLVHDLLPLTHPHFFHHHTESLHIKWLEVISRYDGAICVSRTTSSRLREYLAKNMMLKKSFEIRVSLNGSKSSSLSTTTLAGQDQIIVDSLFNQNYCLIVGTVEPRKGIDEVLDGFENFYWINGDMLRLVVVGKEGWLSASTESRMVSMHGNGYPLVRIKKASDSLLSALYQRANVLIAASYDEGFGLPLVEARDFNLKVLARNIPVFLEVSGGNALYVDRFDGPEFKDKLDELIGGSRGIPKEHLDGERGWISWGDSCANTFSAAIDFTEKPFA